MSLRSTTVRLTSILAIACCQLSVARAQPCTLRWDPQFARPGASSIVRVLQTYDDGTAEYLFAAGSFTNVSGTSVNRIARWNGTTWFAVGSGVGGTGTPEIFALEAWQNRLYVGGTFTSAGGAAASRFASWNGVTWAATGGGTSSTVFSLAGTETTSPLGPALYAGGNFNIAGTTTVNAVTRWDGTTFNALGTGMLASDGTLGTVNALLIDSGLVYAGGTFVSAGGIPANYIARWNGSAWSSLGSGMGGVTAPNVNALTLYNGNIIAGGSFESAGGTSVRYIASWNGSTWSALGSGMYGVVPSFRPVLTLTTWNDGLGDGTVLFAGGQFVTAGGIVTNQIARWNGTTWSRLSTGMNSTVRSLKPYNSALYAGGLFTTAGGRTSERIAQWRCIPLLPEACCFPLQGTCRDLNFNACQNAGGVDQGQGTTCTDGRCTQACCDALGGCSDHPPTDCRAMGATPQGDGHACGSTECPRACCRLDHTCVDMPPSACPTPGQSICAITTCPQACCLLDGFCQNLLPAQCTTQAGVPQGASTSCTTSQCGSPQACCLPDNRCENLLAAVCGSQGGTPRGLATNCSTVACPQACCLTDNTCAHRPPSLCSAQGGTPQGRDTSCLTYDCNCAGTTRGDFTGDGLVRGDDIPGFIAAMLAQPAAGSPDFCRANLARGDVPERLDAADVTAFVNCLLTGGFCP